MLRVKYASLDAAAAKREFAKEAANLVTMRHKICTSWYAAAHAQISVLKLIVLTTAGQCNASMEAYSRPEPICGAWRPKGSSH